MRMTILTGKRPMTAIQCQKAVSEMFDRFVPSLGQAESVYGEILRAHGRIGYRAWNDGDHLGIGYGNETCNAAGRYLQKHCDENVAEIVREMWGCYPDDRYDRLLEDLTFAVYDFLLAHPELQEEATEDMWSLRDPEEDVDDTCEDEDDWW